MAPRSLVAENRGDRPPGDPFWLSRSAGGILARPAAGLALAGAGYLVLAVLVTWPLVFYLRSRLAGMVGVEDLQSTFSHYWWWKVYSAKVLAAYAGRPLLTAWSWLPSFLDDFFSFPLRYYFANFLDFFWIRGLELLVGFPAFYNLNLLFIFAANGLSAFALVRERTRDWPSAFAAGSLYAFTPFFVSHLAYSRLLPAMAFWPPLMVLFFLRFLERGRWRDALLAGLMLGLAASTHFFYAVFLGMWVILALALRGRAGVVSFRKLVPGLLIGLVVAWIVVFPFVFPYLNRVVQGGPLRDVVWFADFPALASAGGSFPFKVQAVINDAASPEYLLGAAYEYGVPLALTLLALAPLVLTRARGAGLWLWTLGIFYTLSLGPYLKWLDHPLVVWGHGIPLPYVWFFKFFPFFSRLNWPSRLSQMVLLALVVLAGDNLFWLRKRLWEQGGARGRGVLSAPRGNPSAARILAAWLPLVCLALPWGEMLIHGQVPIPGSGLALPPVYARWAQVPGLGIIEAPPNRFEQNNFYIEFDLFNVEFAQTFHHCKFLWENRDYHLFLAPTEAELVTYAGLMKNSFTRALMKLNYAPGEDFSFSPGDLAGLKKQGYRYLVLRQRSFCNIGGDPRLTPRRGRSPEEAQGLFQMARRRLESRFGAPVAQFDDYLWTGGPQYPPSYFTFRKFSSGRYPVAVFDLSHD